MTHTYNITGMTCTGCQAKVQALLSKVPGVKNVQIDLPKGEAVIAMDKHVATAELKTALADYPKYQLTGPVAPHTPPVDTVVLEDKRSWVVTYKPLLLIFGYIIATTLAVEWTHGGFHLMRWMNNFMAGFFLTFSFFKLLNLRGFAESYSMYDVIAKKWSGWGYVYAFIELGLGFAFLAGFDLLTTNAVTLVVMTVSIIGVLQSVLNKRKIKCACLGDVFNLPMTTVTIIEDGLMIGMSGYMLLNLLA